MGVAVDSPSSPVAALASTVRTIIIFVTNITTATHKPWHIIVASRGPCNSSSLHALLLGFNHDKLGNNSRHLCRQQRARQSDAACISAAVSKSLLDQHALAGHHISITEMRVAYDAMPRSEFPFWNERVFLRHWVTCPLVQTDYTLAAACSTAWLHATTLATREKPQEVTMLTVKHLSECSVT